MDTETLRGLSKMMLSESDGDDLRALRAQAVAWAAGEIDRLKEMTQPFRCCLNTPDPGPWKAGVNDAADPEMIRVMHGIRDSLSRSTPIYLFIRQLNAAVQIDNRTLLGRDIQRCLLSNAADRLTLLVEHIDPAPWARLRDRLRDAWAVVRGRAVATHIRGSVYDDWRPTAKE